MHFRVDGRGRPLSWKAPSLQEVARVIAERGEQCVAKLERVKNLKGAVLEALLMDMGCATAFAQQAWSIRQWRRNEELRASVYSALSLPLLAVHSSDGHDIDDNDAVTVQINESSIKINISAEEWQTVKPAVTDSGRFRLVGWVELFSQKLESNDRTSK